MCRNIKRLRQPDRQPTDHELHEFLGKTERLRHGVRVIARTGVFLGREHRHHERIVVPVVGAFDLDDLLPTGESRGRRSWRSTSPLRPGQRTLLLRG